MSMQMEIEVRLVAPNKAEYVNPNRFDMAIPLLAGFCSKFCQNP